MTAYNDNPDARGGYVWITADDTAGRRSRAAQAGAERRRYEKEHGVTLELITQHYSETHGFLHRSAFRYRISGGTVQTGRGPAPVYRAGALAFLDSFAGMLPVTVTRVIRAGTGFQAAPASGEIEVRLNVSRGGYTRGELVTKGAHDIVPRGHHGYRGGSGRINSLYAWQ